MRKSFGVAALAIGFGMTIGSMHAQAPGRGTQVLPPSVSKRGNRQIDRQALNILGLRVGFSAGAFGPISFSEAAEKSMRLARVSWRLRVPRKSAPRFRRIWTPTFRRRSNCSKEQAGRA